MKPSPLLAAAALAAAAGLLAAQNYAPPPAVEPDATALKEIALRKDRLRKRVNALAKQGARDPMLSDVEIFWKAAEWITRHGEFYGKDSPAWTLDALDRGLFRAALAAQGEFPWYTRTGEGVIRGYRSRLDGSVQPYAVTLPADYGKDPRKKYRVDVVLHGRDSSITEVKFIHQHEGRPAAKGQHFVRLDIYGRGNNAYRWAGEADVLDALDNFFATETGFGRRQLLDDNRVVLRGFSMGGAGTWHLGLQHPGRWCCIGPGAGFTTTHGYVPGLPEKLPPYQEACLTIYDAVDYAENAFDVPVVAYSGADDKQKEAADRIEARLKKLGLLDRVQFTHLVAPGLGHRFPPEWQQKAEALYARYAAKGRSEYPKQVRFVTCTLRYPACKWVELIGLDRHYQPARVQATHDDPGYTVRTANVRALKLQLPVGTGNDPVKVAIDGQEVECRPYQPLAGAPLICLEKRAGKWSAVLPERLIVDRLRRPQKAIGQQGPIDDAFMDTFLCVRGTGRPWNPELDKYAHANLERFRAEWDRYFRGELVIKDDVDVTAADIAG
ncbi:MAG TPA: hypothetical protein VFA26_23450, partial [Gemmataceae bacterium]|nr:hypothetical protein [Gemmataceae bacterium]